MVMCLFFARNSNAQTQGNQPLKLIGGIALTGVGIFLAVDGFTQVEVKDKDISDPSFEIIESSWFKEKAINWWADAWGTGENDGNVDLETLTIQVDYYDAYYGLITSDHSTYDNVKKGDVGSWLVDNTNCGSSEPVYAEVSASYTYNSIYSYKKESKNTNQGVLGLASAGIGLYLIIDYVKSTTKLTERTGIDFELVNDPGNLTLLAQRPF